ncbi:MAG: hypothetical protein ACJ77K_16930 [Bacteroidia bacterium]
MKKIIFFLFVLTSFPVFSQEVTTGTSASSSVPNDYELTDKQFSAWKRILNNWLGSDFQLIETENKVVLNCKHCDAFYMEVEIKVGANGKMEYYKMINGTKCGMTISKPLELRIMRNFFKFEFPPELRNVAFKTRLGEVLKC